MNNLIISLFLFLVSCQTIESKTQQKDNLPIGNNYLLSFSFEQSEWLDDVEIDSLGFVVEAFDPKRSNLKSYSLNLSYQLQDTAIFYKSLKDSIMYFQQGILKSPYYLISVANSYSLYYVEIYTKNKDCKVYRDSLNIGYLATVNNKNKLIDIIRVNAEVEYNATDDYLGAMYIQNQRTFFLSEKLELWIYDLIRKLNPINTEYSLLEKRKYYINDKGLFVLSMN